MQASLTYPPEADLISGDNPVYVGNVNRGESRTVNWTLVFAVGGAFNVDVNASGYKVGTGEYVEKHGSGNVNVHPYTDIDVDTVYNMITSGLYPDLVVLDVRTQGEYDGGHIYGAVWIPVSELEARISELAGYQNHEITVYCRSGVRSATASEILGSHNFAKVYNMLGGILAWQDAGYPVWIATVHNINTTFNYDTIQSAIDATQTLDGHTIIVNAGTYYENITVNKSVSLIGEDREKVIITKNLEGPQAIVEIVADNVTFSEFTVLGNKSLATVGISGGDRIVNNKLTSHYMGMHVSAHHNFSCNLLIDNYRGIMLSGDKTTIVAHNEFYRNSFGIKLYRPNNATIVGNIFYNNSIGIDDFSSSSGANNSIVGNVFAFNDVGIDSFEGEVNNTSVYHNEFINNSVPANAPPPFLEWEWDNGYPSGGNFWSDYNGTDLYSGPGQNETGNDGIGDTPYVIDANNTDNYPIMSSSTPPPDIAVINVSSSKTVVGQGHSTCIHVTVENQGGYPTIFNVTLYGNSHAEKTIIVPPQTITLSSVSSAIVKFAWNTTGFAKGNYTISAYATPVLGETDTADNNFTDGQITVAMVGDITGPGGHPDGKCDIRDIALAARKYGATYPDPGYDPNCDVTGPITGVADGKIDIRDIALLAKHFGEIDP